MLIGDIVIGLLTCAGLAVVIFAFTWRRSDYD